MLTSKDNVKIDANHYIVQLYSKVNRKKNKIAKHGINCKQ